MYSSMLKGLLFPGHTQVAEQGINPFGEDHDDFDMNWLLDRHFTVGSWLSP